MFLANRSMPLRSVTTLALVRPRLPSRNFLMSALWIECKVFHSHHCQESLVRKTWPRQCDNGKIIIPDHVVDGLNLIWHSDLVISGGGTMNREAAALGVPVYSIFRGKIGAVDQYLANSGRLVLLESVKDIYTKIILNKSRRSRKIKRTNRVALHRIVDEIVGIVER